MSNKSFPNPNFSSENRNMAYTAAAVREEMQQHVRAVAALAPDDGRKSAFAFAAGVLGLPYPRVRALFYGLAGRIDAHEADQIRAYVQQAEALIKARQDYEQRRQEFLANAPRFMARLVPPALPAVVVQGEEAEGVAADRRGSVSGEAGR